MMTVTSSISGMLSRLPAAPAAAASDLAEALHDASERAREEGGLQGRTHAQIDAMQLALDDHGRVEAVEQQVEAGREAEEQRLAIIDFDLK